MNKRTGTLIGAGFACFWLWLGASSLPQPWSLIVGIAGALALVAILLRRSRDRRPGGGGFARGRYLIAVAAEFGALALLSWALTRTGLQAFLWPAAGIVIGLHFVGLWWASGQRRFLGLSAAMTMVNALALLLSAGPMLTVSGLGSYAALAATIALA